MPPPQQFKLTEVGQAPNVPGVYVWYGCLVLGQADLTRTESLLSVLDRFSLGLERQRMTVMASLNFGLEWAGSLEVGSELPDRASTLRDGLAPGARQLVYDLLMNAHPLFFHPLYIGKAEKSLRQRLSQHAGEFLRLRTIQREIPAGTAAAGEDSFAQRAAKLGFKEDSLCCYALPIGKGLALEDAEVAKAVSLVESYLNHWAAPLLGRR